MDWVASHQRAWAGWVDLAACRQRAWGAQMESPLRVPAAGSPLKAAMAVAHLWHGRSILVACRQPGHELHTAPCQAKGCKKRYGMLIVLAPGGRGCGALLPPDDGGGGVPAEDPGGGGPPGAPGAPGGGGDLKGESTGSCMPA